VKKVLGTPHEYKVMPVYTLKVDQAQGVVEQVVAVFGNVDLGGDRIWPGAFAKTIQERGLKIRVLDQHQTDSIMRVIGKPLAIREIGRAELPTELLQEYPTATGGLLTKTQYLLDTPEGLGAFARISSGAVDEASIGFDALDTDYTSENIGGKQVAVRNLRTLRLWEYSPVIWGMNSATMVLSAKGDSSHMNFETIFKACLARLEAGEDLKAVLTTAFPGFQATPEVKGAIPPHTTAKAPEGEAWSKPALKDFTDKAWGDLSDAEKSHIAQAYAYVSGTLPPATFGDLHLPHHTSDMKVVWNGVHAAAGRMNQVSGLSDEAGVKTHLATHYKQFGKTPPWEVVKEGKGIDFQTALTISQNEELIWEKRYDIQSALREAIDSCMEDATMQQDQKIALIGTSLDQYKQAMLDWCMQTMAIMQGSMGNGMATMAYQRMVDNKAGARHNVTDQAAIQQMHDLTTKVGAKCPDMPTVAPVSGSKGAGPEVPPTSSMSDMFLIDLELEELTLLEV